MSLGQRKCLTVKKDEIKQKRLNYFKVLILQKLFKAYILPLQSLETQL